MVEKTAASATSVAMPITTPGTTIAAANRPSKTSRMRAPIRSMARAAMVPKTAASAALVKAISRLFCKAWMRKVLEKALPYHSTEKPVNSLALRPALNEKSTTSAIGA
jgi:hypothetical protein